MGNLLKKYLPREEFSSYEEWFENFKIDIPEDFNFGYDVVDAWAAIDEEKPALVWCDDRGGRESFSFGDISKLSNKSANLFSSLGIAKGDVVLVILRRRHEYWHIAAALNKIGAVIVPATLQLTSKDIAYRVNASKACAIVVLSDEYCLTQTELAEEKFDHPVMKIAVNGERDGWFDYSGELPSRPDTFERVKNNSTDPMLMYFTSGTTGMPKPVLHNFAHPLGHIITAKYWQRVQDGKLHMSVADSAWAKFGWGKIYGQWLCGAVIFAYDMDKYVPAKLLEKLEEYRVTTFCAPPTMYRFMLQEDLSKYDLSSLENCCNAGEPLNPEVFRKFEEYTGLKLREGFGQSETVVLVANTEWFEPRPGSMGKPVPLYGVDLLDTDGNPCETGVEGELVMRFGEEIPGLFRGYVGGPEHNAAIKDGIYRTGDMAWRDDDGYYWFVGRNDDVIKCSGYRIGPFEVESALIEHPSVVECAVTAAPDPVRGQVVKATVVLKQGVTGNDNLVKELQAHVKRLTAPYKYPRIIEFTDELPKTVGGKIKRAQIRQQNVENSKK